MIAAGRSHGSINGNISTRVHCDNACASNSDAATANGDRASCASIQVGDTGANSDSASTGIDAGTSIDIQCLRTHRQIEIGCVGIGTTGNKIKVKTWAQTTVQRHRTGSSISNSNFCSTSFAVQLSGANVKPRSLNSRTDSHIDARAVWLEQNICGTSTGTDLTGCIIYDICSDSDVARRTSAAQGSVN